MKLDNEQIRQNREYLRKLNNSQRNRIAAKEGEMERVRELYDKKVEAENINNEKRLLEVQDRNKAQLVDASANQESKLNEIKQNFLKTQEQLRERREALKSKHQAELANIRVDHQEKAKDLYNRSRDDMLDLNDNVNDKIKKTRFDTQQAISEIENKSRLKIDKAQFDSGLKTSLAQNDQAKSLRDSENRFKQALRQSEGEHKNRLAEEQFKQQMELKTRKRIQQDRHNAMEKHYQELLVGEKRAFEQKYAAAVKEHQSVLKELDSKLHHQMQEAIKSHAQEKKDIQIKENDPFYDLETLESHVREDGKFYYLDIPTPEHEKDNYVVTTDKRKIKIRFSRSSEERLDNENGGSQQSRRSESLTKEFSVDKILDGKKIKTAYNDGVLTFKIAKA